MASQRRAMHESGVRLEAVQWLSLPERRRARRVLRDLDGDLSKERKALVRKLKALRSEYRHALSALMGPRGADRYRELRDELARAPRSRRIRESSSLLDEIGLNRVRASRLQNAYLKSARALLAVDDGRVSSRRPPVLDAGESPWITYTAPFGGSFWSYAWDRSDEASDPSLARYLDPVTGRIGSSISTRLSGADDDDFLNAEYYTALNVWHTALATGPMEGYVALAFRTSTYSGRVTDEFGLSNATYTHWARARLRVIDPQGASDTQESRIFNFIDTVWGGDDSWSNYVAVPNDVHWYYFRTAASFTQGRALLLEAGVWNVNWFTSDDESITMADDLDLRLDRIMVRSCPP